MMANPTDMGTAKGRLMEIIKGTVIEAGSLGIFWLGQAGFILKTPMGKLIAIDPYLTDLCNRLFGFKRIMPPLIMAGEMEVDYLFVSHEHADHFDTDALMELADNKCLQIFGPVECERIAKEMGVAPEQFFLLEEEKPLDFGEFTLLPVIADHGNLSSDALGFIFDFRFVKIYFSGDTGYSPEKLKVPMGIKPEIALLPINGEFGNLNSREAVLLARDLGTKMVIPCHFWTFVEHGSNPLELKKIMEQELPECKLHFLAQGEGCIYRGNSSF